MNAVREWAIVVSFAFVISAVLEMITPSAKLEKIINLVLNIFILCMVIFPLKSTADDIKFNLSLSKYQSENTELKEKVKEQTENLAKSKIEDKIRNIAKNKNIYIKKINIFMDTNEDNCISINKINVYLDKQYAEKGSELERLFSVELGIPIEVLGSDT